MTEQDYENYVMSLKDEKPMKAVVPEKKTTDTRIFRHLIDFFDEKCYNSHTDLNMCILNG